MFSQINFNNPLFYKIYSVIREKFDETKNLYKEREHRKLSEHCDDLRHEADMLKSQLELVWLC